MHLRFAITIFFSFFSVFIYAQEGKEFAVYLIGDAGEDLASGPALLMLEEELKKDPESAVVFLGDNIYPSGFDQNDPHSKLRIESQLRILEKYKGKAYFIPGNHDWDAQKRKGYKKIEAQKDYVNDFLKKNSALANKDSGAFFPANGLPGPETVMLTDKLRLVMIDSQWFLHFHKKNKIGSKKQTKSFFYKRLDSILNYSDANGQQVLIASHHPIFTNGSHAKKLQPWRFLVNCTPFKIFGICGLDRLFSQDIYQRGYKRMRTDLLKHFESHHDLIYAAGHEHNIQYFIKNNNYYIVSGNGSKTSPLRKKKRFESVFQDDSTTGFVKLKFKGKDFETEVYRVGQGASKIEKK